jgi:hypothetical protein
MLLRWMLRGGYLLKLSMQVYTVIMILAATDISISTYVLCFLVSA